MGDGPDNGVSSPEDKGVSHDGSVELGNLGTLCSCESAAAGDKLPDDYDIGNAGKCVPSPDLEAGVTESSEQTGQDHDDVGGDGGEDASTVETREKAEVEDEQRSGQSPVDIASIVDWAVDVTEGVGNVMVVVLANPGMVPGDAAVGGHGEVRESSDDGDQRCDVVVESLGSRDSPRQDDEEQGGNDHENEDNP